MKSVTDTITVFYDSRRFHLIAASLIILLILLAYSNTFNASFHFDDDAAISENHAIKRMNTDNIISLFRTNRPVS
jgi:hypothetical protein